MSVGSHGDCSSMNGPVAADAVPQDTRIRRAKAKDY